MKKTDINYYNRTFHSHNTHGDKPSHISQRQFAHTFLRSVYPWSGVGDAFLQGQCPSI